MFRFIFRFFSLFKHINRRPAHYSIDFIAMYIAIETEMSIQMVFKIEF